MAIWDTVAFGSGFITKQRGHVIYRGTDDNVARRMQYTFAARLNKWKNSYSVYLLKDGRAVGSIVR